MYEEPLQLNAPAPQKFIDFSSTTDKQSKIELKLVASNLQLEFFAKISDKNPSQKYYNKETESNLLKNAYLTTGGNIEGIFQILEYYIKKNSYKIYEENNSIKLEIYFEHPIIKNITFTLNEEKKDLNTQISELSSFIYDKLLNEIKVLEEKNKEYEIKLIEVNNENNKKLEELKNENNKKLEELKNENNKKLEELKNENNKKLEELNKDYQTRFQDLNNTINNLEKKINDLMSKGSIFNSKILIDENLVKTWLNNRRFKANLLFRMTEDGDKIDTFHNKCDNKGTTIIFIETEEGYIFGGYTELQWDKSGEDKTDDSTFLFSFNNKEKYNKINNNYSIGCYKMVGPKFGYGPQICFRTDLKKGYSFKSEYNTFFLNNKFVDDKENWTTKELEIYQIIYL